MACGFETYGGGGTPSGLGSALFAGRRRSSARDVERAATGLNSVIDDDADHDDFGSHYRVSGNTYLPLDWNPATNPMAR